MMKNVFFKTILQISTWFLGHGKFPAHLLLQLCFPLLKIQQQEKRKIIRWRQRRSWGSFNFLIDWRKSPACWPAGDKNQWNLWFYHFFSTLYVIYIISLNMYFWNISFFKVKTILYHQLSCQSCGHIWPEPILHIL